MPAATLAFDILARDKASRTLDRVADKADKTGRSVDRMARHTKTAHTNTDTLGRSMRDLNSRMGGLASRIGGVAVAMGKVGAVGLGAGLVGVLKVTADFQTQLNTLKAVAGATGDEVKDLSDKAIELGNDLTLPATSAVDAAAAMTELAKGGLSVTESMDAAKGVLQLSAAAQIENAEAALITSNALNAFNLEADQSVRVADLLAAAANASSAEITDVALAMQQSAAVFASAGVPIEDLTTAIGLMANAGIKGSDAGTSLKTMLTRVLAPSSKKARDAMAKLGVSIFDADGNFQGMRQTIVEFNKGLKGLSQEQRVAALTTIFGSDAIRAANVVLADGTVKWDGMAEAVTKQGAAADVAAAKMGGLGGAFEAVKSVLETLALQIGLVIGPAVEEVARWFAERLPGAFQVAKDTISDFVDRVQPGLVRWWDEHGPTLIGWWEGLKTVAGDVLGAIAGWIDEDVLPALGTFAGWLVENEAVVVGALTAVAAAFLLWAINAAAAAVATVVAFAPVIILAAAVGGLTALLYQLTNKEGEGFIDWLFRVRDNAMVVAGVIGGLAGQVWSFVTTVTNAVAGLAGLVGQFLSWVWDVVTTVKDAIKGLIDAIGQIPSISLPFVGGGGIPFFDNGGVMPGPRGVHSLALVAGGETILPTHRPDFGAPTSENITLNVTQLPGEGQVDAGMRALRHHKRIRLEVGA